MNKTGIEYLTHTWNPTTGCSRVSGGCKHCWARAMTERFKAQWGYDFTPRCHPDRLLEPLHRTTRATIGVSFMGDLFHEGIPDEFIDQVFAVMARAMTCGYEHTFQVLTKRPERMAAYLAAPDIRYRLLDVRKEMYIADNGGDPALLNDYTARQFPDGYPPNEPNNPAIRWPLTNVWLGTSIEDQATADERIPHLLRCPAALRYVSYEPGLGLVDLDIQWGQGVGELAIDVLDWVICGGESGKGARPMHPNWPRDLRDQCEAARVPFFFKQWGEFLPVGQFKAVTGLEFAEYAEAHPKTKGRFIGSRGQTIGPELVAAMGGQAVARLGTKRAGKLLDGKVWDEVPGKLAVASSQLPVGGAA